MRATLALSAIAVISAATLSSCGGGNSVPGAASTHRSPAAREKVAPRPGSTSPTTSVLPPDLRSGGQWDRLQTDQKAVALTFDCGADDGGLAKILAALQSNAATGTFFMTGKWAQTYPAEAQQVASSYGIGNHTFDHQDLTKLPDPLVTTEVTQAAGIIQQITGRSSAPLFRFPYGAETAHTRQIVNSLGYGDIYWTVDTLGWMGTSAGQSVASATSRVMAHLGPGEIVLMHCGASPDHSTIDADALPGILAGVRAQGYGFVTINQFMPSGP